MEERTNIDPDFDASRWQRIKRIVAEASELDLDRRRDFLTECCRDDAGLRAEAERLLESFENGDSFLETPALADAISVFEEKATRIDGNSQAFVKGADGFVAGTVLASRYRILGLLGKGGMGEVYKAEDIKLGQIVALKFLPDRLERDVSALERFHAEVRTARQVSHPNVCRVFDIGEIDGRHFLSMEFIDGDDLSSLLRRVGRLSSERAVEIARELCIGLSAIHNAGILHRDFKPANVIVDGKGKARITDFGIAGLESEIARDRLRVGTPAYMSPEQIAGKDVSARSDIYSLGLVLYEIFTGKQAFTADSIHELIRKHQTETPTNPSEYVKGIDPLVESAIARCLEKDPKDRPESALHVAMALPGGNPMQIALDAGETPSPEMVAASPKLGALSPLLAGACVAGAIVMLFFTLIASMQTDAHNLVPFSKPPEVLTERVNEIVSRFGYSDSAKERHSRFYSEDSYSNHIREGASREDWGKISSGQPMLLTFSDQQSPGYFDLLMHGNGMWTTGPMVMAGMRTVSLDTRGRLVLFEAVPPEHSAQAGDSTVDFSPAFSFAELDISKFTKSVPQWTPPHAYDTRSAWEGVMPEHPEIPLRVEAAGFDGKIVYFKLAYPWTQSDVSAVDSYTARFWIVLSFFAVLILFTIATAGFLVRKNLKSGSGDRNGAFKTSLVVFGAIFVGWFFSMGHVPAILPELGRLAHTVRIALFVAAGTWIFYLALEPVVRRNLPDLIVSWNRLLAGDWRDPLVGRDVLLGTLLAIAGIALIHLAGQLSKTFGFNFEPLLETSSLISLNSTTSMIFTGIGFGIVTGFMIICIFVMIFLGARSRTMAAILFFLLLTTISIALFSRSPIDVPIIAVIGLFGTLLNVRAGLLATIVSQIVHFLLMSTAMTTDPGAWFAGDMIVKLMLIGGLLAYGYRISTANNSLFDKLPARI